MLKMNFGQTKNVSPFQAILGNLSFPPPKKKQTLILGGVQNIFVKNEENQSCSKLPEMVRKLIENDL